MVSMHSLAKEKITLWEEFGEKFCPYLYNNDAGPYIVIVNFVVIVTDLVVLTSNLTPNILKK